MTKVRKMLAGVAFLFCFMLLEMICVMFVLTSFLLVSRSRFHILGVISVVGSD